MPVIISDPNQYRGKSGEYLTLQEWVKLSSDYEYSKIATDYIGSFHISTVWIGCNPFFETMIFTKGSFNEHFVERYETLEEAKKRHEELVEKLKKGWDPTIREWK